MPDAIPTASQTVITGSHASRTALLKSLALPLSTHANSLVLDHSLLPGLPHTSTRHYLLIVSTAHELHQIITHIPASLHKPTSLAIIIVNETQQQLLRIRHAALHHLNAPGIIIPRTTDGRAVLLFSRLANEWASGSLHTQQQLANVWGDPVFASEHDLIIPPAWDTDGKIRAVADASALDFDYLVASYAWGECEVESPAPLPHQEYEHRITASAQEAKERFETDRESWLASLQLKVDNLNRSHDHASVAQPDPTDVTNVEPPQSDFFQRLLAKGRI